MKRLAQTAGISQLLYREVHQRHNSPAEQQHCHETTATSYNDLSFEPRKEEQHNERERSWDNGERLAECR